jgi:hypothetical protein
MKSVQSFYCGSSILNVIIQKLAVKLSIPMESNLSSWILPALLTLGCVALVMNNVKAKKMNKSLLTNIDSGEAEVQECSRSAAAY